MRKDIWLSEIYLPDCILHEIKSIISHKTAELTRIAEEDNIKSYNIEVNKEWIERIYNYQKDGIVIDWDMNQPIIDIKIIPIPIKSIVSINYEIA